MNANEFPASYLTTILTSAISDKHPFVFPFYFIPHPPFSIVSNYFPYPRATVYLLITGWKTAKRLKKNPKKPLSLLDVCLHTYIDSFLPSFIWTKPFKRRCGISPFFPWPPPPFLQSPPSNKPNNETEAWGHFCVPITPMMANRFNIFREEISDVIPEEPKDILAYLQRHEGINFFFSLHFSSPHCEPAFFLSCPPSYYYLLSLSPSLSPWHNTVLNHRLTFMRHT